MIMVLVIRALLLYNLNKIILSINLQTLDYLDLEITIEK